MRNLAYLTIFYSILASADMIEVYNQGRKIMEYDCMRTEYRQTTAETYCYERGSTEPRIFKGINLVVIKRGKK